MSQKLEIGPSTLSFRAYTIKNGKHTLASVYGTRIGNAEAMTAEQNASRIVECVNAHDALLARVAELEAIVRGYLATADAKPSKVKISDLATMDARARYALKGEK